MNSQVLNGTAITDTSLVDLCAFMNAAAISNIPILLSAQSAGALVKAMTTFAPMQPVAVPVAAKPIAPAICPITGRKFWGNIDHPERGLVATYGGPFDTYSIPYLSDDNELRVERFDQDAGDWVEGGEPCGWYSDEQHDAAPVAQGDAKDAARYRQLRDGDKDGGLLAFMAGHSRVPADVVDNRIDAAIAVGALPVIEKEGV